MEIDNTKGNWFFKEQGDANDFCILTKEDCGLIKWVASFNLNGTQSINEQRANAKLMAAAPELFEACERALQVLEQENIFGQARLLLAVAIKKATV